MSTVVINSYRQATDNWYDGADAAWQPKGAASLAASYLDLTGNGHTATTTSAPTWDAVNGWKFDGISQFVSSNTAIPPMGSGLMTGTIIIAYTNSATAIRVITGVGNGSTLFQILPNRSTLATFQNGTQLNLTGEQSASGVVAMASNVAYINGVAKGTTFATGSGTNTFPLAIGARNLAGTINEFLAVYVQGIGIWYSQLDPATVATKSAQMAAL